MRGVRPPDARGPGASRRRRAEHLDVEVADLLAQRIAVEAEQRRGADLVAARGRQRGHQQRTLDVLEDAVVEARWRQLTAVAGEVAAEVALDHLGQVLGRLAG